MTLLLLSNTAWSFYKFRKGLIVELVKNKYEVVLVAPEDEYTKKLEEIGATFISLKHLKSKGTNVVVEFRLFIELYKIYKEIRPDLVIQYTIKPNIYGSLVARCLKISCIGVVTGLGYTFINRGFIPFLAKKLYRIAFKKIDEVWFLNCSDEQVFLKSKLVAPEKMVVLNGEGVNCSYFSRQNLNNHQQREQTTRFILPARMLYDKGIREFVDAASIIKEKYKNVSFTLMGYLNVSNPTAIPEKKIRAWEKEGCVNYIGSRDDIRDAILSHDCVVLPSYREGMSMILMESAALEMPIITTDIPGCKELVDENSNGFLCKPKNVADLAKKIEAFINLSMDERIKMGKLSRAKILSRYDEKIIINTYLNRINFYQKNLLDKVALSN